MELMGTIFAKILATLLVYSFTASGACIIQYFLQTPYPKKGERWRLIYLTFLPYVMYKLHKKERM
jgi:hypothetical protein